MFSLQFRSFYICISTIHTHTHTHSIVLHFPGRRSSLDLYPCLIKNAPHFQFIRVWACLIELGCLIFVSKSHRETLRKIHVDNKEQRMIMKTKHTEHQANYTRYMLNSVQMRSHTYTELPKTLHEIKPIYSFFATYFALSTDLTLVNTCWAKLKSHVWLTPEEEEEKL